MSWTEGKGSTPASKQRTSSLNLSVLDLEEAAAARPRLATTATRDGATNSVEADTTRRRELPSIVCMCMLLFRWWCLCSGACLCVSIGFNNANTRTHTSLGLDGDRRGARASEAANKRRVRPRERKYTINAMRSIAGLLAMAAPLHASSRSIYAGEW